MHPIAINFGSFAIHWYGIMVATGFLAGLWTASRRAPSAGIHGEKIFDLGPWLIAHGITKEVSQIIEGVVIIAALWLQRHEA